MTAAAEHYARMVRENETQRLRVGGESGDRWDSAASRFRQDPRRPFDEMLTAVAAYIRPDDVVLDVGGGAGRYSLPLALHCREVINVEPSKGMGAGFEASAAEAGIKNARWVGADWLSAAGVEGDVSLIANVTYFVEDIVPFVEKLMAASRRRVIIGVISVPPPNQGANIFEAVYGEPQALVPGHRELLPVLWDMGILPDVLVVGANQSVAMQGTYASRAEAIEAQLPERMTGEQRERARGSLEQRFDSLFEASGGTIRRKPAGDPRQLLVTWETTR
jgi:hypothetical protein